MKPDPTEFSELVKDPKKLLQRLLAEVRLLSQPIDFADLERRGILSKEGAWYRVSDLWDLPEHASHRIREVVVDAHGSKVRFATRGVKTLAKRVEKMAVKEGLI
jgi:hypothetical protein